MSREVHVRFWESAAVQSRRATHLPLYRIWTRIHIRYYESAQNMGTGFCFALCFPHPCVKFAA